MIRNVNKNQMIADKEYSLVNANARTLDAQIRQKEIENLLTLAISVDPAIDWNGSKEKNKFGISNPKNKLNIGFAKNKPLMNGG